MLRDFPVLFPTTSIAFQKEVIYMSIKLDIDEIYNYRPWSKKPWGVTIEFPLPEKYFPFGVIAWNHFRDKHFAFSREIPEDTAEGILSFSATANTFEEAKQLGKACTDQIENLWNDWSKKLSKIYRIEATRDVQDSRIPVIPMAM